MSEFVGKCINSFRVHNPDHSVRVLNRSTVNEYITVKELKNAKSHQYVSDFIRLALLEKYGGIWADASIVCNKSLNEWVHKLSPEYEFIGFTTPSSDRIIENWFLAAEKGSKFIKLWYEEAMKINDYDTRKDYVDAKVKQGVDLLTLKEYTEYLAIYISAMKVLQLDKYPGKLKMYNAIHTGYYHHSNRRTGDESIKFIRENIKTFKEVELIKFNGVMRNHIITNSIDLSVLFQE